MQHPLGLCGVVADSPDSTSFPMLAIFSDLTVIFSIFRIFLASNGQIQMILSFERQRFGGIFQVVIVYAFSRDF